MQHTSELATPRKRRDDNPARERTSISLRADIFEAAKEIVQSGGADTFSAFVEEALEEKLRRARRAALYDAYQAAAEDPAFISSMRDVSRDFAATELDGLKD